MHDNTDLKLLMLLSDQMTINRLLSASLITVAHTIPVGDHRTELVDSLRKTVQACQNQSLKIEELVAHITAGGDGD